jgi:hypothetical protein
LRIWIKLGTMPAEWRSIYKARAPEVGEVFKLRPRRHGGKAERVRCDKIRDLGYTPIYFVERI